MRYYEFRRQVQIMWHRDRYQYTIDPGYQRWIIARIQDVVFDAAMTTADQDVDGPTELRDHIAHDLGLDKRETARFRHWWDHVLEHGFNPPNPLGHLHQPGRKTTP